MILLFVYVHAVFPAPDCLGFHNSGVAFTSVLFTLRQSHWVFRRLNLIGFELKEDAVVKARQAIAIVKMVQATQ